MTGDMNARLGNCCCLHLARDPGDIAEQTVVSHRGLVITPAQTNGWRCGDERWEGWRAAAGESFGEFWLCRAGRTAGQEGLGFQEIRAVGGGLNIWSTVEDNNSRDPSEISLANLAGKGGDRVSPGQSRAGDLEAGRVVVGQTAVGAVECLECGRCGAWWRPGRHAMPRRPGGPGRAGEPSPRPDCFEL